MTERSARIDYQERGRAPRRPIGAYALFTAGFLLTLGAVCWGCWGFLRDDAITMWQGGFAAIFGGCVWVFGCFLVLANRG